MDGNQRNSLESFRSRWGTFTLTLGGLWGPTPFLAAVLWSEFPGLTDLTHRGPPPLARLPQGSRCSPDDLGGKSRGSSALPDRLPDTGAHPRLSSGFGPDPSREPPLTSSGLTCLSPETQAPPHPPRVPGARVPGPTQQWRSRKLAPRLPQAGSGRGPGCGRAGRVAASAFLLPAWR